VIVYITDKDTYHLDRESDFIEDCSKSNSNNNVSVKTFNHHQECCCSTWKVAIYLLQSWMQSLQFPSLR